MSERFSKLSSLPENLYATGSPVIISAGNLLKDNQTNKVLAQLKIKNISTKSVKGVKVLIRALDIVGNHIDGDIEYEYLDLNVSQGKEFGQKVAILLPNAYTRGITVGIIRVAFVDNKIWENANNSVLESLPQSATLDTYLHDSELVKQYKIKFGKNCTIIPIEYKDLWCCACGAWNKESICYCCKNEKADLFTLRLEELSTQKDKRLEQERISQEKREREEKRKQRKKKIAFFTLILAVGVFFLITELILPEKVRSDAYKEALHLHEIGEYDLAINTLQQLGDYKDCNTLILKIQKEKTESTYQEALSLYQQEDYRGAYNAFQTIKGYKDVNELMERILIVIAIEPFKKVGNTVSFGSYEQDNNTYNGKETIEWIVLANKGSQSLLISRYALDSLPYNSQWISVTWETCSLRTWLNSIFFNAAFSAEEQEAIITTNVDDNENGTNDKIFLLSNTEAEQYFQSHSERSCKPTAYAVAQNVNVKYKGNCWWWLRLPHGESQDYSMLIQSDGTPGHYYAVFYDDGAVRPAFWIDLESDILINMGIGLLNK